ncbi:MAG: membrane protein insertase YidC [Mycobacteriales bacterium]
MPTGILDPLYKGIAYFLVAIHKVTKYAGGAESGLSWALAIVLLTATVRLILFPLFVKQIRSQKKMTAVQPLMKELQAKHKGDRATLNIEMQKLYKEHGVNPLAGCLPLLAQMPIFISLFTVLRSFQPKPNTLEGCGKFVGSIFADGYCYKAFHGVNAQTVQQAGKAKVFGAPIAGAFTSNEGLLKALGADQNPVKIVTLTLIILMAITTFITQRQMMAKNAPTDAAAATQQKVLLYVMPGMMAVFGINVALGVLIYWTTTNIWSMAQQRVVLNQQAEAKIEPVRPPVSEPLPPGYKPPRARKPPTPPAAAANGAATGDGDTIPTEPAKPPATGANRNNRKKGPRRGGRR